VGTGILRNPEDSGINTGIPVPQEILRKIPVITENKTGIPVTSPKPRSCEKLLRKTQEKKKSSGILAGTVFSVQKINS